MIYISELNFLFKGISPEEVAREADIKNSLTVNLRQALKTLQREHVDSAEPIFR